MHWYGKKGVSKNRKLGHITIVGSSAEETADRLSQLDPTAAEALQRSFLDFFECKLESPASKQSPHFTSTNTILPVAIFIPTIRSATAHPELHLALKIVLLSAFLIF